MRLRCLLVLPPLLSACASMQQDNRLRTLDQDVAAYYDHLRWGHYEEATVFQLPPSGKDAANGKLDHLKHIHVSTYEILSRTIAVDKNEARIAVNLEYYNDQNATARSTRDEQRWVYIPIAKHWKIQSTFPDFLTPQP